MARPNVDGLERFKAAALTRDSPHPAASAGRLLPTGEGLRALSGRSKIGQNREARMTIIDTEHADLATPTGAMRTYIFRPNSPEKSRSIVFFDEIEKAHPDLQRTLMQVMDKGVMPDSLNLPVSFKDCILVFASNVLKQSDFGEKEDRGDQAVRARLVAWAMAPSLSWARSCGAASRSCWTSPALTRPRPAPILSSPAKVISMARARREN